MTAAARTTSDFSGRWQKVTALGIALLGDEPPNEFRIFTAGPNETTKGTFLFDGSSATAVMAEYQAHGIDLMLDYDHASLGVGIDPALSGKAAGWFNLDVRNGELWAVNVRWTPPAAEALRRKEWRFMSPAFTTDDAGRVTSVLNVALTNLPATRRLEPLMAARAIVALGGTMDPKQIAAALDAIEAGDAEKCKELLKGLIAGAAGGGETTPAAELAETPATEPADPEKEKPEEVMAATSLLTRLTGKKTITASVAEVEVWLASHVKLETETQKLAAERATLEAAERRKGCVELVTLAGRAPANVWADDTATAPKKYLATMSIADFRDYVTDAIKACGGKPKALTPPAGAGGGAGSQTFVVDGKPVTLDARELKICADQKCDPATFAMLKARRTPPKT